MSELDDPPATVLARNPDEWARRFDLLSDPTRLRLLTHMHQHPDCTVSDLATAANITQTAASQALRVLRDQDWVKSRRSGRAVHYTLVDPSAHYLLHSIGDSHDTHS